MNPSASFLRRPTEAPWSALKFVKVIGEGRFGTVWLCEDGRTGEQYACKKVLKVTLKDSLLHQHFLRQEVALLDSMAGKHPNIIELKYVFEDLEAIYLMMEFCDAGDLFTYVTSNGSTIPEARSGSGSGFGLSFAKSGGKSSSDDNSSSSSSSKHRPGLSWGLPENKAVLIFRQVAQALHFCHRNGIMHRDIKLENVLICTPLNSSGPQYYYCSALPPAPLPKQPIASDVRVLAKLADFGLAVHLAPGEKTVGTAGSRPYEAPEVILGQEYDMKADVWSLGVLLFGMLSCAMPFQGHGDRQLMRQILRGNVDLSRGTWSTVSAEAKDLIRAMLSVNPDERISMAQVVAHPWIKAASRRKPVVTTSFAGFAGATGAISPVVSGSLTPRTPVHSLVSPPGCQKNARASDLPSLDPCSNDEDDTDEKNRLVADGEGDEGGCGLLEKNIDQDADVASRKKRDGIKDKENACPPVQQTAAQGVAGDAALGPSIVQQGQVGAGGAEKQGGKGKASLWDSFIPALGPSRGKWRMGF